jgi:DNA-binding NarL/FixJ family response regulator
MTMMQRTGGIASAMNDARSSAATPSSARPGEGISDAAELARLIALVRATETQNASHHADMVIGEFTVPGSRIPITFAGGLQQLSRSEAAVMRFLGWGRSNADIASLLGISEATARTHMNNCVQKLDVDGIRELIGLAGLLFHPLD